MKNIKFVSLELENSKEAQFMNQLTKALFQLSNVVIAKLTQISSEKILNASCVFVNVKLVMAHA